MTGYPDYPPPAFWQDFEHEYVGAFFQREI